MQETIKKIKKQRLKLKSLPPAPSNSVRKKQTLVERKQWKKVEQQRRALKDSVRDLNTYLSYQILVAAEKQELSLTPLFEGTITQYRYLAGFEFTNNDLRKVRGYNLLCSRGFYNRETNILGVVKDHRISIKYGFENNIDPKVIGHPANCEFLYFKQNAAKSADCSITLEQLKEEIKNW